MKSSDKQKDQNKIMRKQPPEKTLQRTFLSDKSKLQKIRAANAPLMATSDRNILQTKYHLRTKIPSRHLNFTGVQISMSSLAVNLASIPITKSTHKPGCIYSLFHDKFYFHTEYPKSLNISLHLIISDFVRRRQLLKSKCS